MPEDRPDSARALIAALLWAVTAALLLLVPGGALPGAWVPGTLERAADKTGTRRSSGSAL